MMSHNNTLLLSLFIVYFLQEVFYFCLIALLNISYLIYKEVYILNLNKKLVILYLKEKEHNGLSFARISELIGYPISYLKKLKIKVENKDIKYLKTHDLIIKIE